MLFIYFSVHSADPWIIDELANSINQICLHNTTKYETKSLMILLIFLFLFQMNRLYLFDSTSSLWKTVVPLFLSNVIVRADTEAYYYDSDYDKCN